MSLKIVTDSTGMKTVKAIEAAPGTVVTVSDKPGRVFMVTSADDPDHVFLLDLARGLNVAVEDEAVLLLVQATLTIEKVG